jgi:single-strand DNA-binding protein
MSKSVNRVTLLGRLTKPVEVKYTPSGAAVANFSLALNEKYKDKAGAWQEKTEFVNVVVWQRLAEIAGEYLQKGAQVYVEGKLQTRNYEKDGRKIYVSEVIGNELVLLSGNGQTEKAAQPEAVGVGDDSSPF